MRLLLHIGTGKTGSTAIQASLDANRDLLAEAGILYPKLAGRIDHNKLAIAANHGVPREFRQLVEKNGRDLVGEAAWAEARLSLARSEGDTIVLSCEYFSAGVDVERLCRLLEIHFPRVREIATVCYLRPPAASYLSTLQQDIKASSLVSPLRRRAYAPLLARYAHLGTVTARLFHRSVLREGDVVRDFLDFLPARLDRSRFAYLPDTNVSISAEGMAVLQEFRRDIFPSEDNIFKPASNRLLKQIQEIEAQLRPGSLSKPRLRPEIVSYLSRETEDSRALRKAFGVDFHRVEPAVTNDAFDGFVPPNNFGRNLSAVLLWNEEAKALLVSRLLDSLL